MTVNHREGERGTAGSNERRRPLPGWRELPRAARVSSGVWDRHRQTECLACHRRFGIGIGIGM